MYSVERFDKLKIQILKNLTNKQSINFMKEKGFPKDQRSRLYDLKPRKQDDESKQHFFVNMLA